MFRRFSETERTNVRQCAPWAQFHAMERVDWGRMFLVGAISDLSNAALCTYLDAMAQSRLGWIGGLLLCALVLTVQGCERGKSPDADQEAAVVVDGFPLTATYLDAVRQELPPYATQRFSGEPGQRALLARLVDLELIAGQARAGGWFDDPRVQWTLIERVAQNQVRALLERSVPRVPFEQDTQSLASFIEEHSEELRGPKQRRVWMARVDSWSEAARLELAIQEGRVEKEDVPNANLTPWMTRDDQQYPVFHRAVFDPALGPGEWLPGPVSIHGKVFIAQVQGIRSGELPSLDDPRARAKVVDAAILAPRQQALETYLQGLRARWPLRKVEASPL